MLLLSRQHGGKPGIAEPALQCLAGARRRRDDHWRRTHRRALDGVRGLAFGGPRLHGRDVRFRRSARRGQRAALALGLPERREDVVRHGRAGFVGYVARDATIDDLQAAISDAVAGRLQCPAEISGGLIRALFSREHPSTPRHAAASLTRRETEVLQMIGRGLSNKEIARDLDLSVATIKCHVHNVLAKLGVGHRSHAMRKVRAEPWIGARF
jgi:DNA-binding NarL/FixJ family response regulator